MLTFVQGHLFEIVSRILELVVLGVIFRELWVLKKHHAALRSHESHLLAARPLMSTLYTGDHEIMALAIESTEKAESIYGLGTIASLAETERRPEETATEFSERINSVDPSKRAYVTTTLNRILSGAKYRRIFDFTPDAHDAHEIQTVLANIRFFLRAIETPRKGKFDVELYHNADVTKGRGDFHFRWSEQQVVIRVGGHGNGYANAAISINDTRVIDEFKRYYESLLVSPRTRRLTSEDLEELRDLLQAGDIDGVRQYLQPSALEHPHSPGSGILPEHSDEASSPNRSSRLEPEAVAVIAAAGRGSRMGELTLEHQKCMLNVGGRPLIARVLDQLTGVGVRRAIVLVGYRADEVTKYVTSLQSPTSVEAVRVSALSTARALCEVRERLGDQFWYVHANVIVRRRVLQRILARYLAYFEQKRRFPSAVLATVPPSANLTHAVLRKAPGREVTVVHAHRWNGPTPRPCLDASTNLLSLGVALISKSHVDWDAAVDDTMMVEALIRSSADHPILAISAGQDFAHFETEADLRKWDSSIDGLRDSSTVTAE